MAEKSITRNKGGKMSNK